MGEQHHRHPGRADPADRRDDGEEPAGTILYALGMTQHTTGVQGIRAFTILQLLLGNLGKPGSGVNALRGEPNVQGACDMGVLNNYLPGYMDYPSHDGAHASRRARRRTGPATAGSSSTCSRRSTATRPRPRTTSATRWLPKKNAAKNYGTLSIFEDALAGKMKLLWIVGQNPAVTTPNLTMTFAGMDKLETLVVQEIWETETAAFWKRPGVDPKSIQTEVFLLPAAFFMEKNGTITQLRRTGAVAQRRGQAAGKGACPTARSSTTSSGGSAIWCTSPEEPKDDPIKKASWTYLSAEDRPERDERIRLARPARNRSSRPATS